MKKFYIDFNKSRSRHSYAKNCNSQISNEVIENVKKIGKEYGFEVIEVTRIMIENGCKYTELSAIFPINGIYLDSQIHDFFKKVTSRN